MRAAARPVELVGGLHVCVCNRSRPFRRFSGVGRASARWILRAMNGPEKRGKKPIQNVQNKRQPSAEERGSAGEKLSRASVSSRKILSVRRDTKIYGLRYGHHVRVIIISSRHTTHARIGAVCTCPGDTSDFPKVL